MPVQTVEQQLEECQAAISRVMKSQEYQSADLKNKLASLKDLTDRETVLLQRFNRAKRGTARSIVNLSRGPL